MQIEDYLSFWLGIGLLSIYIALPIIINYFGIQIANFFTIFLIILLRIPLVVIPTNRVLIFCYFLFAIHSVVLMLIYSKSKTPKFAKIGYILSIPSLLILIYLLYQNIIPIASNSSFNFFLFIISINLLIMGFVFNAIIFKRRKIDTVFRDLNYDLSKRIKIPDFHQFFSSKYLILSLYIIGAGLIIIPQIFLVEIIIDAWSIRNFFEIYFININFFDMNSIWFYFIITEALNQKHYQFGNLLKISFPLALLGILISSIGMSLYISRKRYVELEFVEI